ncbi:MAG: Haloacid dehalogenase domain protein hydrolase [Frondihabitans sp.]|nr:Haloacid dehalogenase domain protein hydrolase [Frondihabitans sp.]
MQGVRHCPPEGLVGISTRPRLEPVSDDRRRRAPSAIVFDLFGTLIPSGNREERDAVSRSVADVLGVDREGLSAAFRDTFDRRTLGELGDLPHTLALFAERLGASPSATQIDEATALRVGFTGGLLQATWALPLVEHLHAAGFPLALVSDCSAEVPMLWPQSDLASAFSASAFSCTLGIRKPAPEMYLHATRQLGVDPTNCLYVGDGGSDELAGAAELGMTAVLYTPEGGSGAMDAQTTWPGRRITSLEELRDPEVRAVF